MKFNFHRGWFYSGIKVKSEMYFLEENRMIINHNLIDIPSEMEVLNHIRQPWDIIKGKHKLPQCKTSEEILSYYPKFETLLEKLKWVRVLDLHVIEFSHDLKEIDGKLCRKVSVENGSSFYILEKYYHVVNYAYHKAAVLDKVLNVKARLGKINEIFIVMDGSIAGWFMEYLSEQLDFNDKLERDVNETNSLSNELDTAIDNMQEAKRNEDVNSVNQVNEANDDGDAVAESSRTSEEIQKSNAKEFPGFITFHDHEKRGVKYIDRLWAAGLEVGIILEEQKSIFWITDFNIGSSGFQTFKTKKALNEFRQEIDGDNRFDPDEDHPHHKTILLIPYPIDDPIGYTFRSQTDRKKCNAAGLTVFRKGMYEVNFTSKEFLHWHKYDENNHDLMLANDANCITEEFTFIEESSEFPEPDQEKPHLQGEEETTTGTSQIPGDAELPASLVSIDTKRYDSIESDIRDYNGHKIEYLERLLSHNLDIEIIMESGKEIFRIVHSENGTGIVTWQLVYKTKKAVKDYIKYCDDKMENSVILVKNQEDDAYCFRGQTDRMKAVLHGLTVYRNSSVGLKFVDKEHLNFCNATTEYKEEGSPFEPINQLEEYKDMESHLNCITEYFRTLVTVRVNVLQSWDGEFKHYNFDIPSNHQCEIDHDKCPKDCKYASVAHPMIETMPGSGSYSKLCTVKFLSKYGEETQLVLDEDYFALTFR